MNTLFKKFLKVTTFATLVAVWLTAGTSNAETQAAPTHVYNNRWVYTEATYRDYGTGKWYLVCAPSGNLLEVKYYGRGGGLAVNVFDRNTGKPVFCDPATGKVFESK